jgi:hypothetical protein
LNFKRARQQRTAQKKRLPLRSNIERTRGDMLQNACVVVVVVVVVVTGETRIRYVQQSDIVSQRIKKSSTYDVRSRFRKVFDRFDVIKRRQRLQQQLACRHLICNPMNYQGQLLLCIDLHVQEETTNVRLYMKHARNRSTVQGVVRSKISQ